MDNYYRDLGSVKRENRGRCVSSDNAILISAYFRASILRISCRSYVIPVYDCGGNTSSKDDVGLSSIKRLEKLVDLKGFSHVVSVVVCGTVFNG